MRLLPVQATRKTNELRTAKAEAESELAEFQAVCGQSAESLQAERASKAAAQGQAASQVLPITNTFVVDPPLTYLEHSYAWQF